MNDQHVFSYMDSCFLHTLPGKIEHIRPLRAVDFQDEEEDDAAHGRASQPHRQQHATPALLLEDAPRDPSPGVDIDAMDIDRHDSEGDDYEEPEQDDDDKEAPSEQDTDEAASRGEEQQLESQSDSDSIQSQRRPHDFRHSPSPLQARVLDFAEDPDHVTSLADDPLEEPHQEVEQADTHDDDDDDGGDEHEGVEEEIEEVHEEDPDEAVAEDPTEGEEADREAPVEENTTEYVVGTPAPDLPTTSRPPSPPHRHESGEDIPPPSPPKPKASKRGKHKDRQSKRHSTRSQEPAITETWVEEKIVGIMNRTLPTMLSGLLQEAMSFARQQTPQPVPQPAPTVEVAVGAAEIERDITQVEVGVQGMEVDRVDGATHMEAEPATEDTPDDEEANVSIQTPSHFNYFLLTLFK